MAILTSPGVNVSINDQSIYAAPNPTTVPLFIVATRSSKTTPDGTGTALGTLEANKLRVVTSQRDLIQNYGNPTFVTSSGVAVHGDETNEYGLMAAYSFLGRGSRAYILRADIDLGGLVPTTNEPILPPVDSTYWINSSSAIGGIFKYDGTNWVATPFKIYTTSPIGTDGADGDWAFDYSTLDGTIKYKSGGTWKAATNINIQADYAAANSLTVSPAAPTTAVANDFWYKTVSSAGGVNLSMSRFRAVDGVFVTVPVIRSNTAPVAAQGTVWEDTSNIATTAARPLYIGTGTTFISLSMVVQATQPVTTPATGTIWYDSTYTDFALYVEGTDHGYGNQWVPITTTTVSNPTSSQKVISASAPTSPNDGAIWVDISSTDNFDNYPIIKRWQTGQWIDITTSVKITDSDPIASAVLNGTYWLNTGSSLTRNTIKTYDPTFTGTNVTFNGTVYVVSADTANHWKPAAGTSFGRKAIRTMVVTKLQAVISSNTDIRAEENYFQLITCPGYPELYDEMIALNTDKGEIAFVVADIPKFTIPSGIPTGREVTVAEWVSNARSTTSTNETGFSSARSPYAAFYSPWGLTTDVNGNDVFVPPSHMALRTLAYSDSVSAPWYPPAGLTRGRIDNATSVGYLTNSNVYTVTKLTTSMRDIMYENNVNPLMFKPNKGLVVYGQKTWASSATALDRINVARLITKMKYDLQRLMEPFLFEINDPVTRRSAQIAGERYMAGLKSLRAVYDYAVRCDENNNTASRIDRNELWVDIAIQPAKSIEFIYIPVSILNTGQTFPF